MKEKKDKEEAELAELTFQPNINKAKSKSPTHANKKLMLGDFLRNQEKYMFASMKKMD